MPIVPLFGHGAVLARLQDSVRRGVLPASLLLHGPAGIGKQRLALELANALLCTDEHPPCGGCESCRFSARLAHPDLHWFFPRPRPKDNDQRPSEVDADYRELIAERVDRGGLYAPASGSDGLFVATVRAMLQQASVSPALGRRKVFVVGGAERMVPQEGSDQAANAFLKLLEEPPANTTLILTSSEVGALLPTIRSRVVALRVAALPEARVRDFLGHELVRAFLASARGAASTWREQAMPSGAQPGQLLADATQQESVEAAQRFVEAARTGGRAAPLRIVLGLGASKARGGFTGTLDALAVLTHERVREAASGGEAERALRLADAMDAIEEIRELARGNVNPQLAGAALARSLTRTFR